MKRIFFISFAFLMLLFILISCTSEGFTTEPFTDATTTTANFDTDEEDSLTFLVYGVGTKVITDEAEVREIMRFVESVCKDQVFPEYTVPGMCFDIQGAYNKKIVSIYAYTTEYPITFTYNDKHYSLTTNQMEIILDYFYNSTAPLDETAKSPFA